MSRSMMTLLPSGRQFEADTREFAELNPFLQKLADYMSSEGASSVFAEYRNIVYWAIRRLEYSFGIREFQQYSAEHPGPLKVLDVGCGVVPLGAYFASKGHAVTACDEWAECIEFLISRVRANERYGTEVKYERQDASFMPYEDESFDMVQSISVLEHTVPGRDWLALDEMVRVLKVGGQLVLTFDCRPCTDDAEEVEQRKGIPPGVRIYEFPFLLEEARALLGRWDAILDLSPDYLEPFRELSGAKVEDFWRSHARGDRRETEVRTYAAMGLSVRKTAAFDRGLARGETDALRLVLLGQDVLNRRLDYYRRHAAARMKIIDRLKFFRRLLGRK